MIDAISFKLRLINFVYIFFETPGILHTLSLYMLILGGPVELTSYIYMYDDDLDSFGKPAHQDCFQKCICISNFTGGF